MTTDPNAGDPYAGLTQLGHHTARPLSPDTATLERIRRRIATEPFAIQKGERKLEVTISIGIAAIGGSGDTAEAILKRADTALYRAKRDGRNRVVPDAA